jgi:HAD superfamily phosphoserine phosphatase-like hydrolase
LKELPKKGWTEEVHTFLQNKILSTQGGFSVFDFDNTIIKNDFGEAVMNRILKSGLLKLNSTTQDFFRDREKAGKLIESKSFSELENLVLDEYEFQLNQFGLEAGYRWSSFIFSGFTELEMKQLAREVWASELSSKSESSVKPYPEILDLIEFMQNNSWNVYIVTASPAWIIEAISINVGIRPENVFGMEMELIEGGINSSQIIEPYPCFSGKTLILKQNFNEQPDLAFGDSPNDKELLLYAKNSIFIDRVRFHDLVQELTKKRIYIQPKFYV